MSHGYLSMLLHAHLPYVRHPEYPEYLEEGWLFEAISETYVPLLWAFERLRGRGLAFRMAMDMSPPLCEMLDDDLLIGRFRDHLDRLCKLASEELSRRRGTDTEAAALMYRDHFHGVRWTVFERLGGRILPAFADLQRSGHLEVLTCTATHGFLPVMRTEQAVRAQVQMAQRSHERHFGAPARGMWLAECGYRPGVEEHLAEAGLDFFYLESHGLLYGRPRPTRGVYAACRTPRGPAAFARDPESGRQVWSNQSGYPGHPQYREFYRDLGYDAPYEQIRPYLMGDGVRRNVGFKFHRITGRVDLGAKELYDPAAARDQAALDAADFVRHRQAQVRGLERALGTPPLIVSPYDCELFGHWWFEGPTFLEEVLDRAVRFQRDFRLVTPSEYLARETDMETVEPAPSSWGAGGYSSVWVNRANDWMVPHLHEAEQRMVRLARAHDPRRGPGPGPLLRRALNQALRELLLAQSSDWPFIITMDTSPPYAHLRFRRHVEAFLKLSEQVDAGRIDEPALAELESRHNIFRDADYELYC